MTQQNFIKHVEWLPRFKRDYKKLSPELQQATKNAIRDLLVDSIPGNRRFEKLRGYRDPSIYTIHVTSNHSHKISFEINGDIALLRRISSHKEIDRVP